MTSRTQGCEIRAATCRIADVPAFLGRVRAVAKQFSTHVICFNANMLAGKRHAETALRYAVRSCSKGVAISNTLEMEALLCASGSRQCNVAASFGIHEGENRLWVCCYPPSPEIWVALCTDFSFPGNEGEEIIDREKRERLINIFGITLEELGTLDNPEKILDLVLERVALLEVQR
ncbi:MAG TPA: KEOPS complex subunit Cgi121 [Methanoregula sp.]|nr:KEOPS complex subunit Cgi121 [Methanoregula sp.]